MHTWHSLQSICKDGTILTLVADGKRLWAGSPAGLFVLENGRFRPVAHEVPFWGVNALALAGNSLLVAGLPHGLIRSSDRGQHWLRSTITHTQKPITCLATSPNVVHDGVVLAGTAGDGVLRSIDGGRYWELVNFGLRDFDILGISCAPAWQRREIAVAVTAQGLYQSPNGGRAWRQAQVPADVAPQSVCFSHNFAEDQTVFAGTEGSGLLVSDDQGLCWEKDGRFPSNLSVTWLGQLGNSLVAATGDGQLLTSNENGQSWQAEQISRQPILAVTNSSVGLAEAGLLAKDEAGNWQPVANVAARRFSQLCCTEDLWAAAAPLDGLFVSRDGGGSWRQIAQANPATQIQDLVLSNGTVGCIQAGRLIWDGRLVAEVASASCLTSGDAAVYAGTSTGQLWQNRGDGWQRIKVPWRQTAVLALACQGEALVIVVRDRRGAAVSVFYRSRFDSQWESLGTQNSYGQQPRVALLAGKSLRVALGIGGICWLGENGAWTPHKIGSASAPITNISVDGNGFLCTTFDAVHRFIEGNWLTTPAPEETIFVAAQGLADKTVALALEGRLFAI